MRISRVLSAATLVAVALGACSTASPPRFHSLLPAPASVQPQAAAASGSLAWEVLPVTVPAGVDQPQWVVRTVDGSFAVLEQERWVGPLGEEIRGAVNARLTQTVGAPALAPTALWRVRIDVLRFESAPAREARLEVTWSVVSDAAAGAALRCRSEFVQVLNAGGYVALAKGHQQGVAQLADAIGRALEAMGAGRTGSCAA